MPSWHPVSDIAFSPAVKAFQERNGSRTGYERLEDKNGWSDRVAPKLAQFIAARDSFYLAIASVVDDVSLLTYLLDADYGGKPEQAIVFTIEAWDVNCPQHIKPRYSNKELDTAAAAHGTIDFQTTSEDDAELRLLPHPQTFDQGNLNR